MFNFWKQPRPIRWVIKQFIPKRDTWKIDARKDEYGDWVFNIPPFIKDEALTGGTQTIIDEYFRQINGGEEPKAGDEIAITASVNKPAYYQAICEKFDTDISGFGHVYVERNTQMIGWFCPVFDYMFGYIPDKIYVSFASKISSDDFFEMITGRDINSI